MTEEENEYRRFSKGEIRREAAKLKGWKIVKGKLHRDIDFANFEEAVSFMVRASFEIAKLDHHPEWSNVYSHVSIDLVTHDVGGLSNYDFKLARIINGIFENYKSKAKSKGV